MDRNQGSTGQGSTVIVFAGDFRRIPAQSQRLPSGALVIAADSGLDHADAHGVDVDLVLGDLDSVTRIGDRGGDCRRRVDRERPPAAKDDTDLELALDAARGRAAPTTSSSSGGGGRLDHLVTGLLLLAARTSPA